MPSYTKFSDFLSYLDEAILNERFDSFVWRSDLREKKEPYKNPDQPWGDISLSAFNTHTPQGKEAATMAAMQIYKAAEELARNMTDLFRREMQKFAQGGKLLINIKSPQSFIDKVVERGKHAGQIHDMLRGAILFTDKEDVDECVKQMRKKLRIFEYEYKSEKSANSFGYYGSHHFKIYLENAKLKAGMIVEVQVMTHKLWSYKKEAHKLYDKWRSAQEVDAELRKRDIEYSRHLFKLGNK